MNLRLILVVVYLLFGVSVSWLIVQFFRYTEPGKYRAEAFFAVLTWPFVLCSILFVIVWETVHGWKKGR